MLSCEDITHDFTAHRKGLRREKTRAVDSVTLQVEPGEVTCIVGESCCGKTTLGRIAAGLCRPTEGTVTVDGDPMYSGPHSGRRRAGTAVQLIHQDPFAALNPALTVLDQLTMPLLEHEIVRHREVTEEAGRLLDLTGLTPADTLRKYPHQLSGGQRQRVVLARALTLRPKYLVGDEAVTMVDVSSRLVLLGLLRRICVEQNIGLVFITHDFAVARYISYSGKIIVLYRGRIVEHGPTEQVIQGPQHPYTRVLLSAIPPLVTGDYHIDRLTPTDYEVTGRSSAESGCVFTERCPLVIDKCRTHMPPLQRAARRVDVACYLADSPSHAEKDALTR